MAVFVMSGCPGDEAEVEITEVARRFARGVVRRVITPSPDRTAPQCPHFGECGGCQLQHISYAAQLSHKTAMVRDALSRIASLPAVEVGETWGMQEPWRYRGRADYHAEVGDSGELTIGFARHRSRQIVPLSECDVQHPLSERIRQALAKLMGRVAQSPSERAALLGVETLISFASGRGLVTLVCDGRPAFLRSAAEALMEQVHGVAGVLSARRRGRNSPHRSPSEPIVGEAEVVEELNGRGYRVSADSFFQSNPGQAARMVSLVQEWAQVGKGDVVYDLYSGVGTFLLPLAATAGLALGVEAQSSSVADAKANLRRWKLRNVRLYERNVERLLPRLVQRGKKADVIVLDPPRKGCGPVVCISVARLEPRRIVLVSCDPATLARDLKTLAEHGYRAQRVQPIDMFPQTWHVECVALCERA
jgi:23S rRNA (uracil1939-C5)-methyltransferase